jgi:hypothetical protein
MEDSQSERRGDNEKKMADDEPLLKLKIIEK